MEREAVTESRNVVAFAELAEGDRLIIETSRSTYVFTMRDSSRRLGSLGGGRLVSVENAYALGAVSVEHAYWKGGIRVGDKAVFLAPVAQHHDTSSRLVTSYVVRLQVHWRERRAA